MTPLAIALMLIAQVVVLGVPQFGDNDELVTSHNDLTPVGLRNHTDVPEDEMKEWNSSVAEPIVKNQGEESNEIEDPELTPKIINGRDARQGEFPWMVALHFNGRYWCSSFLISPTVVMTAAHCVVSQDGGTADPPSSFYGIIGNVRRTGPDRNITFNDIAVHPRYNLSVSADYDIALMQISEPVELNELIQPVCIPSEGRLFQDQPRGQAMGWGIAREGSQQPPEILQTATLPIVSQAYCQFIYGLITVEISDRHICAGIAHRGICFGDSGGPLVLLDIGPRPVAVGVASFITFLGCARPFIPGVYAAISSYMDWVLTILQNTSEICIV